MSHKFVSVLFSILITLFLNACSLFSEYTWLPPQEVDTMEEIQELMQSIKYVHDPQDNWKLPHETYETMQGDCEDTAALMASIMIYNMHYNNVKLVYCTSLSNNSAHMIVWANDTYYGGALGYPVLKHDLDNFWDIYVFISYKTYINLAQLK